jgi:uncharacterized glyoxalase superfamily protein PhnB
MKIKFVPKGFQQAVPYLMVRDAAKLIEFAKKVFKAKVLKRLDVNGVVMNAQLRIGDCVVMLSEARGEWQPMPAQIYLYVPKVDATYQAALKAGATSVMELRNEFYGDRAGGVKDASGNIWWLATHIEDVSPKELKKRLAKLGL